MLYYKKTNNALISLSSHISFCPNPLSKSRSILLQGLSINWASCKKAHPPRPLHNGCPLQPFRSKFKCNEHPQEALPGPTNLAGLYPINLFYFSHATSYELKPFWFIHVYFFLEHKDSASDSLLQPWHLKVYLTNLPNWFETCIHTRACCKCLHQVYS